MEQKVLAVVAGKEITEAEFELFLQNVPREQQAYLSNPQFRQQCLDQMISMYLFAQYGQDEKLNESEEYLKVVENVKREILAQMAIREVMKGTEVSDQEILDYYEANKQQFTKGDTVSARHILTDSEEKCSSILEEIQNGNQTFEDAAKEFSTCPSGAKGGDLGEFGRGQMVKEFEEAAFTAQIGQLVGPVKTQFGYHLIRVDKKNEAATASLDEVKENIRRTLLQKKQNERYDSKVAELRAKYVK